MEKYIESMLPPMDEDEEIWPATDPPAWAKDIFTTCHEAALLAQEVYPPSDDSFLMLEALLIDSEKYPPPTICLEVGPGSGILLQGAKRLWPEAICIGMDRSPLACEVSQRINPNALIIRSSFAGGLRLDNEVDVGIFNPPYVVTPEDEMEGEGISISWAGGENGRVVLDAFIPLIPRLLAPHGRWYICGIIENDVPSLIELIEHHRLKPEVIIERTCGVEDLWVIRITHAEVK